MSEINYRFKFHIYRFFGMLSRLRSKISPDHARVSFYLYCSLDINKLPIIWFSFVSQTHYLLLRIAFHLLNICNKRSYIVSVVIHSLN